MVGQDHVFEIVHKIAFHVLYKEGRAEKMVKLVIVFSGADIGRVPRV